LQEHNIAFFRLCMLTTCSRWGFSDFYCQARDYKASSVGQIKAFKPCFVKKVAGAHKNGSEGIFWLAAGLLLRLEDIRLLDWVLLTVSIDVLRLYVFQELNDFRVDEVPSCVAAGLKNSRSLLLTDCCMAGNSPSPQTSSNTISATAPSPQTYQQVYGPGPSLPHLVGFTLATVVLAITLGVSVPPAVACSGDF
jgi:hypothetical protein